jgi:uncharacterized RDD family membrane protein YckC
LKDQPAPAAVAAASLARRLGSLCYEALLVAAILFVAGWTFLIFEHALPAALARLFLQFYLLAVTAAYFIFCWTRSGQTLPMKTWHIRVVAQNGTAVSTAQAARRYLYAIASIALCGAGFWWALADRDGRFLHDRLAGTKIVRTED